MDKPIISEVHQKNPRDVEQEIIDDHMLRCDNCNKDLIRIIKTTHTQRKQAFQAICPFCNEQTFVYKVRGEVVLAPEVDHNDNDRQTITISDIKTSIKSDSTIHQIITLVTR